mmetsp:Transcript_90830/g.293257  ORF Transcript_90830/g.293257 Transcript_90830/m.293257 type:complete len:271 (-) Transcript_90830:1779-2591(-)
MRQTLGLVLDEGHSQLTELDANLEERAGPRSLVLPFGKVLQRQQRLHPNPRDRENDAEPPSDVPHRTPNVGDGDFATGNDHNHRPTSGALERLWPTTRGALPRLHTNVDARGALRPDKHKLPRSLVHANEVGTLPERHHQSATGGGDVDAPDVPLVSVEHCRKHEGCGACRDVAAKDKARPTGRPVPQRPEMQAGHRHLRILAWCLPMELARATGPKLQPPAARGAHFEADVRGVGQHEPGSQCEDLALGTKYVSHHDVRDLRAKHQRTL